MAPGPVKVAIGVVIMIKSRYNINHEENHSTADTLNNLTVWLIFAVTVINVFVSAFGIDNTPFIRAKLLARDTIDLNITLSTNSTLQSNNLNSTWPY